MKAMSHAGEVIQPNPANADYHRAKFEIYREMYEEQLRRRERMEKF
jgi:hypothetical protein